VLFLLLGFGASTAFSRAVGIIGKTPKAIWAAPFAACLIGMIWCAGAVTTRYLWIPWA
jgi:hypothetical protein